MDTHKDQRLNKGSLSLARDGLSWPKKKRYMAIPLIEKPTRYSPPFFELMASSFTWAGGLGVGRLPRRSTRLRRQVFAVLATRGEVRGWLGRWKD